MKKKKKKQSTCCCPSSFPRSLKTLTFWDLPWETPTLRSPHHLSFSVTDVKTIEVPCTKSSIEKQVVLQPKDMTKASVLLLLKVGFSISTIFEIFCCKAHKVHSAPESLNKGFSSCLKCPQASEKILSFRFFSQCTANEKKKKKKKD